jgi:cytochrome b pre-mRNA-processing protein 3
MFKSIFKSSNDKLIAYSVYTKLVEQSRTPIFYTDLGVADTLDGRFDMIVLHIFLFLRRLERAGKKSEKIRQLIMEAVIADMDRAIRELGVGDMGVGKQVKKLGAGLLGRVEAYGKAFDAENREDEIDAALIRNLYRDTECDTCSKVREYMINLDDWLSKQEVEDLMSEEITLPATSELLTISKRSS